MNLENKSQTNEIVYASKFALKDRPKREPFSGIIDYDTVMWEKNIIDVPSVPYNAGGTPMDYTPEKVLDTLDFYYKMALKDNLNEALKEEVEENHPRNLLNEVLTYALENKLIPLREYNWFLDYRKEVHKKKDSIKSAA